MSACRRLAHRGWTSSHAAPAGDSRRSTRNFSLTLPPVFGLGGSGCEGVSESGVVMGGKPSDAGPGGIATLSHAGSGRAGIHIGWNPRKSRLQEGSVQVAGKGKPRRGRATAHGMPGAAAVAPALLAWYGRARRDLPWRRSQDPYRIWVSEVMLQQTQVERVKDFFVRFIDRFPAVDALAAATEHDVLRLWEGLVRGNCTRRRKRSSQTTGVSFRERLRSCAACRGSAATPPARSHRSRWDCQSPSWRPTRGV